MLAQAVKQLEKVVKANPAGMFAEVKYDGERLQTHFRRGGGGGGGGGSGGGSSSSSSSSSSSGSGGGDRLEFLSRSLKPLKEDKVGSVRDYVGAAFPNAQSMILDAEILLMDSDRNPLPFGTLGVHKKKGFADATVCLFVFDVLHWNGNNVAELPLCERRALLEKELHPIAGRVLLSEKWDVAGAPAVEEPGPVVARVASMRLLCTAGDCAHCAVMGSACNSASRLQTLARPGAAMIVAPRTPRPPRNCAPSARLQHYM